MKAESDPPCSQEIESGVCFCPLEGVIHVISKKWTLQIIALLGNHSKLRFSEIKNKLGNISPKSLSDRLKELQKIDLITRRAYSEIPPRVEYSLTEEGDDLKRSIMPLMEWAARKTDSE
jgi:DNA-binding HxlR family transcriptional regulator